MPEQLFFAWTDLLFDVSEYQHRRQKLVLELNRSGGGLYLTPSNRHFSDGGTFRQLNDFLYFTGLELPDSVLAIDAESGQVILFVPERDPRFENPSRPNDFPGRPLQPDLDLAQVTQIKDIRPIAALEDYLHNLQKADRLVRLSIDKPGPLPQIQSQFIHTWTPLEGFLYHIQQTFPSLRLRTAYSDIARLRMIKSEAEIALIRQACEVGMAGIRVAAKAIKPGIDERTLEGELEAAFKRGGAQRLPFASIIKSGPNALWPWRILAAHYDRRNRVMQMGELVVFDVGCEYNYYGSDMGRTFPVSGQFTVEQEDILTMQLAVLDALIAQMRPSVTLAEVQQAAQSTILADARPYMQVGLFFGHHIGLSPGDPSLPDALLAPGMVITVEPWYYNHDRQIGTFIEDVILVTAEGCENLTAALPRTPAGMAAMVG